MGDFVIRRADGLFAYQLAVVVDDAARGSPKSCAAATCWIPPATDLPANAAGPATPAYAHLPVAVDRRGHKLGKQTGAAPLDLDRPELALMAALRFLGQTHLSNWAERHRRRFWLETKPIGDWNGYADTGALLGPSARSRTRAGWIDSAIELRDLER